MFNFKSVALSVLLALTASTAFAAESADCCQKDEGKPCCDKMQGKDCCEKMKCCDKAQQDSKAASPAEVPAEHGHADHAGH